MDFFLADIGGRCSQSCQYGQWLRITERSLLGCTGSLDDRSDTPVIIAICQQRHQLIGAGFSHLIQYDGFECSIACHLQAVIADAFGERPLHGDGNTAVLYCTLEFGTRLATGMVGMDGRRTRKACYGGWVFSMEGDIAPLPDILEVAKKYNARVIVDDAHATVL